MELFNKIVVFFEWLDFSNYDIPHMYGFDRVLSDLRDKQHKINLHTAYTNTIYAKDDAQNRIARTNYVMLKKRSGR